MNLINIRRGPVACAICVALFAGGCSDKPASSSGTAAENDPRAKVLGVAPPGAPAVDTPGTASTVKSDLSQAQQANAMPLPGQTNDHSTLSPKATQKSALAGR